MSGAVLEDILRFKRTLDSEQCSEQDIFVALDFLEPVTVNRVLLSKTKVGLSLAKLKRHPNPELAKRVRKLLEKWRSQISVVNTTMPSAKPVVTTDRVFDGVSPPSEVTAPPRCSSAPNTRDSTTTTTTVQHLDIFSPASDMAASVVLNPTTYPMDPIESSGDPVRRSSTTLVTTATEFPGPKCFDLKRDKAREILFRAFLEGMPQEQLGELDAVQSGRVAAAVEEALWSHHVDVRNSLKDYQSQIRAIKSNLADKKNPEFNVRIYLGAISASNLATLPSTEMASDAKKRERQKTKRDALEACQSDWDLRNVKRAEGQFPCGKCKSANTTYFQMQTRSSDEPMTIFVSCLDCGNRWKF